VIVINARGITLTGDKAAKKFAYRHSGYPGGLTATQYTKLLSDRPEFAIEKAIKGMLPKNSLGRQMAKKLQVYPGAEHPHAAQKPVELKLGEIPPWTGLPEPKVRQPKAKAEAEPVAPPAKRTTAKRTTARPAAKASTAKTTTARTSTAKKTTAKAATAKKPTARRTKKEA
jgi:topoisomerase IA-like protein